LALTVTVQGLLALAIYDPKALAITIAVNTAVIVLGAVLLAWLTPLPGKVIAVMAIVAWIVWQVRLVGEWKKRSPSGATEGSHHDRHPQ
jgi:hypothetical protein